MKTERWSCDICGKDRKPKLNGQWSFSVGNRCLLTSSEISREVMSEPDVCLSCSDRIVGLMRAFFAGLLPLNPSIVEPQEKKQ